MKNRQGFLASLEEAGVLCIDSEIPHAAYLLDDNRRKIAILPPLRTVKKLQNGYPAVLLTPQEAKKLAEEIIGICEVNFGMEGSV